MQGFALQFTGQSRVIGFRRPLKSGPTKFLPPAGAGHEKFRRFVLQFTGKSRAIGLDGITQLSPALSSKNVQMQATRMKDIDGHFQPIIGRLRPHCRANRWPWPRSRSDRIPGDKYRGKNQGCQQTVAVSWSGRSPGVTGRASSTVC